MGKEQLTDINMTINDMIWTMSQGNPGAMNVLRKILSVPDGLLKVLALDSLDIRGSQIYLLYNDCCGNDYEKFRLCLTIFNMGVIKNEDIQYNLNSTYPIPFIDDSIEIPEDSKFEARQDYYKAQGESFTSRIKEKRIKEEGTGTPKM